MSKIIYDFKVLDKYSIIKVDEYPDELYKQIKIDGNIYDVIPVYDCPQCLGIKTVIPLLGKEIDFL